MTDRRYLRRFKLERPTSIGEPLPPLSGESIEQIRSRVLGALDAREKRRTP